MQLRSMRFWIVILAIVLLVEYSFFFSSGSHFSSLETSAVLSSILLWQTMPIATTTNANIWKHFPPFSSAHLHLQRLKLPLKFWWFPQIVLPTRRWHKIVSSSRLKRFINYHQKRIRIHTMSRNAMPFKKFIIFQSLTTCFCELMNFHDFHFSQAFSKLEATKKSQSTLRAKRATITFWVDRNQLKMPKRGPFRRVFGNLNLVVKKCY